MLGGSKFVHKVPMIVGAIGTVLVVSLFLAPATLPPGTVYGFDARANAMDHWDTWKDMDPFHAVVYTFGDINCHQKLDRTIVINGNQMPVCARDTSIFIGLIYGAAFLTRAIAYDSPSDVLFSVLPKGASDRLKGRSRTVTFLLFIGLLFVPTALDGGIQAISGTSLWPFGVSYESTNPMRVLTGFPMGFSLGLIVTCMLMTLVSRREDGEPALVTIGGRSGRR